jgi:O-acetyl-ADP-ribose deacetylase (regulator of RNase III)
MHIVIARDASLSLAETEDFKRFHITLADPDMAAEAVARALAAIAEPAAEAEHYWVRVAALPRLAGREGDGDWGSRLAEMVAKVQKFGWSDERLEKVKAHVKR